MLYHRGLEAHHRRGSWGLSDGPSANRHQSATYAQGWLVGWLECWYHQTSDGSFSAVSTATIASKDAFFCIFRDLQDLHSFPPLQSQILQIFRDFFRENFRIFSDFCKILLNFCEISAKINKILTQICKISEIRKVQKAALSHVRGTGTRPHRAWGSLDHVSYLPRIQCDCRRFGQ